MEAGSSKNNLIGRTGGKSGGGVAVAEAKDGGALGQSGGGSARSGPSGLAPYTAKPSTSSSPATQNVAQDRREGSELQSETLSESAQYMTVIERENDIARQIGQNIPPNDGLNSFDPTIQLRAREIREDLIYAVGKDAILNEAERQRRDHRRVDPSIVAELDFRAHAGIPYRPVTVPPYQPSLAGQVGPAGPAPSTHPPPVPPLRSSANTRRTRPAATHIPCVAHVLQDTDDHRSIQFGVELFATNSISPPSNSSLEESVSPTFEKALIVGGKPLENYISAPTSTCPPINPRRDFSTSSVRRHNASGQVPQLAQPVQRGQPTKEVSSPGTDQTSSSETSRYPHEFSQIDPQPQLYRPLPRLPRQNLNAYSQSSPDQPADASQPTPTPPYSPTLEHFIVYPLLPLHPEPCNSLPHDATPNPRHRRNCSNRLLSPHPPTTQQQTPQSKP